MKKISLTLSLLLTVFLASCASTQPSKPSIEVTSAEVRIPGMAMPGMNMGDTSLAGFMTIKNNGSTDDSLVGAKVNFAMAMLHQTTMDANGVANMSEVEKIVVPAGQTVELKPGGYHVMFMNPSQELKVGDTVNVTLQFQKAGTIVVQAKVTAP